jgi:hypothetical protein
MARKFSKHAEFITTRGPVVGECNICGNVGRLTEDHTPPKSCRGATHSEMHALHVRMSISTPGSGRHFRTGPSYRSLCARCNNELLGAIYDPALANFCAAVRRATNTMLRLPNRFSIEIQPQLVMRSVIGHLAAMGVGRYRKGNITEPLRDQSESGTPTRLG